MELYKAHNQWSSRPLDERFWTLEDAKNKCNELCKSSEVREVEPKDLGFASLNKELVVDFCFEGSMTEEHPVTNWAFKQICNKLSAPAGFLEKLPSDLVSTILEHVLEKQTSNLNTLSVLLDNTTDRARCFVSTKYHRIWNHQVFDRLIDLKQFGWRVPPARPALNDPRARPATEEDILNQCTSTLSINVGDLIAPAGVYVSDQDMFVFLVNDQYTVDDGTGNQLLRGMIFWNSEVGAASIGGLSFLCDTVCGNHIVWGAKEVTEWSKKHIGEALETHAWDKLALVANQYAQQSQKDDYTKILRSRNTLLGNNKEESLETLFGVTRKYRLLLSDTLLDSAYDRATTQPRYGNPNNLWAITNGITELSQSSMYTDKRVEIDRSAGKLAEIILA